MEVNGILNFRTTSKKDTICSFQKRKKVANTPFLHQIFFFNPTCYCSTYFQHKRRPHFSRILVNLRMIISSFFLSFAVLYVTFVDIDFFDFDNNSQLFWKLYFQFKGLLKEIFSKQLQQKPFHLFIHLPRLKYNKIESFLNSICNHS